MGFEPMTSSSIHSCGRRNAISLEIPPSAVVYNNETVEEQDQ